MKRSICFKSYLNTSHVKAKRKWEIVKLEKYTDLNTLHVKAKQQSHKSQQVHDLYLNTSHVKAKRKQP